MTRSKTNKTKGSQGHGKENASPAKPWLPTSSPAPVTSYLKRSLPEEAEGAPNQDHKRPKKDLATNQFLAPNEDLKRGGNPTADTQQPPSKGSKQVQIHRVSAAAQPTLPAPAAPCKPTKITHVSKTKVQDPRQSIPDEVQHLTSRYDFTSMSILSSHKMETKITNTLARISKFTFSDPKTKPGVVILHAKADCANKMISIAGLVKQNIEKGKGKWWQYTKLEGQVIEMKKKEGKAQHQEVGRTLSEWEHQQESGGAEAPAADTDVEMEGIATGPADADQQQKSEDVEMEEGEEDEEVFETMAPPEPSIRTAILPEEDRTKVRAVPVLTIYLARVPVSGLKELYGEQTNA